MHAVDHNNQLDEKLGREAWKPLHATQRQRTPRYVRLLQQTNLSDVEGATQGPSQRPRQRCHIGHTSKQSTKHLPTRNGSISSPSPNANLARQSGSLPADAQVRGNPSPTGSRPRNTLQQSRETDQEVRSLSARDPRRGRRRHSPAGPSRGT